MIKKLILCILLLIASLSFAGQPASYRVRPKMKEIRYTASGDTQQFDGTFMVTVQ